MVVTMVVWTKQDRMIIDMARFAFQLKEVSCTEDMWVQFYHNKSFQAAKKSWEWVNFNGMRSFVLIPDHFKCGRDWSLEPWLVSDVTFDETNLKVNLDAIKSSWKNVTHTYNIDFGEIQRSGTQSNDVSKRQEFERRHGPIPVVVSPSTLLVSSAARKERSSLLATLRVTPSPA
jgi:hypothetical protein